MTAGARRSQRAAAACSAAGTSACSTEGPGALHAANRAHYLQVHNEPCRWTTLGACGFRTPRQSNKGMTPTRAALLVPAAHMWACLFETLLKICRVVSSCKPLTCCPPVPKVSACPSALHSGHCQLHAHGQGGGQHPASQVKQAKGLAVDCAAQHAGSVWQVLPLKAPAKLRHCMCIACCDEDNAAFTHCQVGGLQGSPA